MMDVGTDMSCCDRLCGWDAQLASLVGQWPPSVMSTSHRDGYMSISTGGHCGCRAISKLGLSRLETEDLRKLKAIKRFIATLMVLLTGCQAVVYGTASDFEKISLGMSKVQVIEVLGSPVAVSADGDKNEEYLIYKRMKHAISEWPRTYSVTLRAGKVVKYGEQYEEKNVNKY